jgi:hypothetical protein
MKAGGDCRLLSFFWNNLAIGYLRAVLASMLLSGWNLGDMLYDKNVVRE